MLKTSRENNDFHLASMKHRISGELYWLGVDPMGCIYMVREEKFAKRFPTKQEPYSLAAGWKDMSTFYDMEPSSIRVYHILETVTRTWTSEEVQRLPLPPGEGRLVPRGPTP